MRYDTTKHNVNWVHYGDAKSYLERWTKKDQDGVAKMKVMHNTTATLDPFSKRVYVTLHWTDIYQIERRHRVGDEFPHTVVTLNSGGYRTVKTKDRMNRFLPINYKVIQRDWNWILQVLEEGEWKDQELYFDGMEIELAFA